MRLSASDRNQVFRTLQNMWLNTYAKDTYLSFLDWSGVSQEALLEDIKNKLTIEENTLKRALSLVGYNQKVSEQVKEVCLYINDYEIRQQVMNTPQSALINQHIGTIKILGADTYHNSLDIENIYPNKVGEYYRYLKDTLKENKISSEDMSQFVTDIDLCITLASGIDDLCKTVPFLGDVVKRIKNFGEDTNKSDS